MKKVKSWKKKRKDKQNYRWKETRGMHKENCMETSKQ